MRPDARQPIRGLSGLTTLSIIVPTPDGGTLEKLHASLDGKLYPGDEVIIVGDTFHGHPALKLVESRCYDWGWRYLEWDAGYAAYGHPQINHAIRFARGDYLVFQDDDDWFAEGAIPLIHRAVRRKECPHLFRFVSEERGGGRKFWTRKGLVAMGAIGGHCIVTPNIPEKTGVWTDRYEGDFDFIVETLKLWEPMQPIWREEVISIAR